MWMRLHQYKEKRGTRAELYGVYQEEGKEKNSLKDMQKVIRNVGNSGRRSITAARGGRGCE